MLTASACHGSEDQGVMIAAASEAIYNNGAACGQYYQVTCVNAPFPEDVLSFQASSFGAREEIRNCYQKATGCSGEESECKGN